MNSARWPTATWAFAFSVLLHLLVITNITWSSGTLLPRASENFIEARVITSEASLNAQAMPVSTPQPPAPPVPVAAEPKPAPAAPLLTSRDGARATSTEANPPLNQPQPAVSPPTAAGAATTQPAYASPQQMVATLPPAPEYHPAGALTSPPRVLEAADPEYPEAAKAEEGIVVLRILISAKGTVDDVAVARSLPAGLFEASALSVFRAARFAPGSIAGVPVKSQMFLELKYTPLNRGGAVSGQRN